MRKRRESGRPRLLPIATAVGVAALGAGLLTNAAAVAEGVRRGLEICGGMLIPSLFPFMVLSGFLSLTDYARILSVPFAPVTTRVFRLPAELGVVLLMSLIGGYPVGAKMIADLLEQGRIDRPTAERMLCFCVNSGPSFLIAAVGVGMFCDRTAGLILFATQTLATLLIGFLTSLRAPRPGRAAAPAPRYAGPTALVMAVQGATAAMLTMCAFAVLFSGLLALPVSEALVKAVMSGFLEVTSGCIAAAELNGRLAFALTSAIVSFSGLSVLFQVFSCFGSRPMNFRPLVGARIAHAAFSTAMALPLYARLCASCPAVWLTVRPPAAQTDSRTTLISVCLLGMCTIFTLSLGQWAENPERIRDRHNTKH